MPNIHLTTSSNLVENVDVPDILDALVRELCRHDSIDPKSVKGYHTLQSCWSMGDGAPHGFAHCEVRLVSGGTETIKKSIADGVHACLCKRLRQSVESGEVAITLELREMDAETYRK